MRQFLGRLVRIGLAMAVGGAVAARAAEGVGPLRVWQPANGLDVEAKLVSQTDKEVALQDASGKELKIAVADLGTEDLRYLRNVREAANEFRTWRLTGPERAEEAKRCRFDQRPGLALYLPETVRGSFVKAVCFDSVRTEEYAILILDDFRRRAYPLKLFSDEDRQYVAQMKAKAAKPERKSQPYKIQWVDYDPVKDKNDVNVIETDHFSLWYGNDKLASGWKLITKQDPKQIERNAKHFEEIWDFYANELKVRVPFSVPPPLKELAGDTNRYKIPVYITGTGLPKHKEGWAFGARSIVIHPGALLEGTSVFPHEFSHVMQLFMGGFRNSDYVGWFWECHANWSCHQFIPGYPPALEVCAERAHYELDSSRHNYGSWPFLQYLAEHPRFTPAFCYDIWLANRKNGRDQSIEDPFQTIQRLGVERGFFRGDGVNDFGDIIGEMAAHNAEWDYVYQYPYHRALAFLRYGNDRPYRGRTTLHPVPDRPGWFRPIFSHTPRRYGYNLIDLALEPGATEVEVDFRGIIDEVEGSDWRVTLVAIDDHGQSRYSRMWSGGRMAFRVRPNERRLVLAVAATQTVYQSLGFRIGFNNKRRFLYEVAFKGCKPESGPPLPQDNDAVRKGAGAPHANGGGFVARSARVDPTAYVGPDAQVLGHAKALGNARIEGHAILFQDAVVSNDAIVSDYARVGGRAKVWGDARVRDCAFVGGNVELTDRARVRDYTLLMGHGAGPSRVRGDVLIRGWGEVNVQPNVTLTGGLIAGEDLEAHFINERKGPLTFSAGMVYGYVNPHFLNAETWDNRYLYAHWDFDEPRENILRDVNADCDGVLRGKPKFGREGGRRYLELNGKDQYALVEGHVVDTVGLTVDMRIQWGGGEAEQRVFEFGSEAGVLGFTPASRKGPAAFFLRKGTVSQEIAAKEPLPTGRWVRVTMALDGQQGRLYVDGKEVGAGEATLKPEEVRATAGYLGRAVQDGGYFNGKLDEIAVYRKAFASVGEIPEMWWYKGRKGTWAVDRSTGLISQTEAKGNAIAYQVRNYRDVVFTLKARKTGGDGAIGVLVRTLDQDGHRYQWTLGGKENSRHYLTDRHGKVLGPEVDGRLEPNRWYDLKMVGSGDTIECYLDGQLIHRATDDTCRYGGVGLATQDAAAEFKDLAVEPARIVPR